MQKEQEIEIDDFVDQLYLQINKNNKLKDDLYKGMIFYLTYYVIWTAFNYAFIFKCKINLKSAWPSYLKNSHNFVLIINNFNFYLAFLFKNIIFTV